MIRNAPDNWNQYWAMVPDYRRWVWRIVLVLTSLIRGGDVGAAQAELKQPGPGDHLATQLSPKLASELWKSRIAVPLETPQQIRERDKLAALIKRVHSTRIVVAAKKSVPPESGGSTPKSVDAPAPVTPTGSVAQVVLIEPVAPVAQAVSDQSLKELLGQISGAADTLENPFELAELLRMSGHLKAAADYYQVALARVQANTPDVARRRAWMLFQAACCLRNSDPKESKRLYQQLLDEYPKSIWSEAAQSLLTLVSWYDTEKPAELIRQCIYGDSGKTK